MKTGSIVVALAASAALLTAAAAPILAHDTPAALETPAAQDTPQAPACTAPAELLRLDYVLPRTAHQLSKSQPLRIVAIGSSSTYGAGASSQAMSYPSRLEAELRDLHPRSPVTVFNRGVNGETTREMLVRFDSGVFAEKPDLVLWQVGSNSVLFDRPIGPAAELLREGLGRLKTAGVDVVLINPQYAPKVLAKNEINQMVDLIDALARQANVDLFQRFALMRYWRLTEDMPFSAFLSKDELHMNDWSYGCLAKLLAGAISDAAKRPVPIVSASAKPRS